MGYALPGKNAGNWTGPHRQPDIRSGSQTNERATTHRMLLIHSTTHGRKVRRGDRLAFLVDAHCLGHPFLQLLDSCFMARMGR